MVLLRGGCDRRSDRSANGKKRQHLLGGFEKRLKEEGASELFTNCKQLKMRATDGKMRLTNVANTEQILRIIQSIPSPKAEPFKRWLAQVGRERIEETIDPEQAIEAGAGDLPEEGL